MAEFLPPTDEAAEAASAAQNHDCEEYCRHCHRQEQHFLTWRSAWYYGILRGFTAGLIQLGPYRCRCCGGYLWVRWTLLDPRRYFRLLKRG